MASPSEIRGETLRALRRLQRQLNSPEWEFALDDADAAVRRDAARQLVEVQRARVQLETAELSEIRDRLRTNEQELVGGRVALDRSLERLERVADVLEEVRRFLGLVERVFRPGR